MRLLIIGALEGQLSEATKLAMQGGAKVAHAATIEIALASLRAGRGADLLFVDVMVDIACLIASLDGERIHIPVVACGTETNAAEPRTLFVYGPSQGGDVMCRLLLLLLILIWPIPLASAASDAADAPSSPAPARCGRCRSAVAMDPAGPPERSLARAW